MIGQTLGHFRILERLGSGGMGVVYRAHDEKLQRLIAIKVVGRDTGTPEADRLRIIEEARAASALSHPHICTVYQTGEVDGQAYIAMEYVEGRALSELIPPEGLPAETVIRYGMQIADALAHAHRRGVIHRDLKTANVVVSSDGRAKVLDFGLARRIPLNVGTAITRSSNAIGDGKLVGTLAYMAPEMLLGQTTDERGDIWGARRHAARDGGGRAAVPRPQRVRGHGRHPPIARPPASGPRAADAAVDHPALPREGSGAAVPAGG